MFTYDEALRQAEARAATGESIWVVHAHDTQKPDNEKDYIVLADWVAEKFIARGTLRKEELVALF